MDERKRLIEDLSKETRGNGVEIERQLAVAGQQICDLPAKPFAGTPLAGAYEEAQALRKLPKENLQKIDLIQRSADREREIRAKLEDSAKDVAGIEAENEVLYQKIGETAFSTFIEEPSDDEKLVSIFSELIEHDKEMGEIGSEIERFQEPGQGRALLKKLTNKGREVIQKSRRGLLLKNLPGLYRSAGRAICDQELENVVDDTSQPSVAQTFYGNRDRLRELEKDRAAMLEEQAEINNVLTELQAEKRPHRRIDELNKSNEQIQVRLAGIYLGLAKEYRELSPPGIEVGQETEDCLKQISLLESKNSKNGIHIERLEASLAIDKKRQRIAELEGKIRSAEERIRKNQEEIRLLQEEAKGAADEVQRLEKLRGPADSLLKI